MDDLAKGMWFTNSAERMDHSSDLLPIDPKAQQSLLLHHRPPELFHKRLGRIPDRLGRIDRARFGL
jgi:hypothetical protein